MKRSVQRMLCLLAVWAAATCAQAQTLELVTEESSLAYIQDGEVAGPDIDFAKVLMAKAGISDFHISLLPWARAYDLALSGNAVMIFPIIRTPARESSFHWVGEYDRTVPTLYRLRGMGKPPVAHLEDARELSVAVVRDDVREHYLQANGFTRLLQTANGSEAFRRLINGQADLVAMSPSEVSRRCELEAFDCTALEAALPLNEIAAGLYLALSRNTEPAMVVTITRAFNALKAQGALPHRP
ncbi:substrate-binding periplasmic protein [Pseudomonas sp. KNUC1026]|uniref:substrate-binding periplasmic protein n=1 Tax=Pseudomonas sp. KNUC1026 TaxID=2893890 RepID=UPI001F3A7107|nr:transporter substrate-binding domain-containing protein [Pseudomonas sp. KNUC1026]UFH51395.1 transporter substrate-binding domain-containing protein [Pseudomonas sp. KNUC1026]